VAMHDENGIAVGQVGVTPGYSKAAADSLRITIYGKGGHGARPESTIDPVVIAASIVVRLQSIISREIHPGDAAVVTVGYIQAGTKNNIIPNEVQMGLTVRSYKPEVRKHLLDAIARIAKAEAEASGADKMPLIENYESTAAVYNDTVLTQHLSGVLASVVGRNNVVNESPLMTSEDWAVFVAQGIPGFYFTLGVADPQKLAAAKLQHKELPSNHSPLFAPVAGPALRTGIAAEVAILRDLMKGTAADLKKIIEEKAAL
jgi:amidohydrolase